MSATRHAWRRLSFTALLVLLAVALVIVIPEMKLRAQSAPDDVASSTKLAPLLGDLAGAVLQRRAPAAADRTGRTSPLSLEQMPKSARDARVARLLRMDENNAVQVYVLMEVTAENLQALSAAGVTIEIPDAPGRRVQARIPISLLRSVAALPFVTFIRLPTYAVRRVGSVTTEGDAILHSSDARSQFGLDGTGVKVGVLSDGIRGVFATGCQTCSGVANGPIATGDLPNATGTRQAIGIGTYGILLSSSGGITGQSFVSGADDYYGPQKGDLEGTLAHCTATPSAGAEGTALLEIVHDVAPNAQLSFANFDTDVAFNQAVNTLAASNDVVIDDIGFYGLAPDGTSVVSANTAAALNNPSNRIRAYITSAGNSADEHYIGTYLQSAVAPSTLGITVGGHLHQFQQGPDTTDVKNLGPKPYNLISLPRNGVVVIFLTWNDAWGGVTNNYDLYLVDITSGDTKGSVVQKGSSANTASDPAKQIAYQNTTTATQTLGIVVQNVNDQAAQKELNIFSFQPQCAPAGPSLLKDGQHERQNFNTAARSVSAQSDAGGSPVSVISAAAICSASSAAQAVFAGRPTVDESCLDASNSTIEFFSSRGPTIDGRTKPDIAGIDGVTVTGAGGFPKPFFGTSAAAPHVAGIAALALQAAPCLVSGGSGALDPPTARAKLRSLLTGNAAGLGDPNTFGSGRADALATVHATLPIASGSTVTVPGTSPAGATITAAQLGFSDPNQCPLGSLKWTGGCGTSPGSAMTCPLGTSSVSVSATNNGVAFSPPVTIQVIVTSFALAAAPPSATVRPGQSAVYQVTVSSQSGPFPGAVTLGCANLPPNATCSFNPPTVAPGAGSAQSTLTISTTAPALAAPLGWNRRDVGVGVGVYGAPIALMVVFVFVGALARAPSRRRLAAMGAASLALAFLATQLACGSNLSPPPPAPAPAVSLSPTSLSFGTQFVQTTSAAQAITLTNSGNAALTITNIAASGDFAQTNTCGASLAAGGSCSISVKFAPTAAGARAGAVTITDNAAGNPHAVSLSGTGQPANGTPTGTYPVSITGTSGALVQSGSLALVVQ